MQIQSQRSRVAAEPLAAAPSPLTNPRSGTPTSTPANRLVLAVYDERPHDDVWIPRYAGVTRPPPPRPVDTRVPGSLTAGLAPDKKLHFEVGYKLGRAYGLLGLVASVVAGAGKEAWDFVSRRGTPETADFTATVRGGWHGFKAWWSPPIDWSRIG